LPTAATRPPAATTVPTTATTARAVRTTARTDFNFDGVAGGYMAAWSPTGIKWTDYSPKPVFDKGSDVGQFMWDPRSNRYLGFVKKGCEVSGMKRRCVARIATDDVTSWPEPELVLTPDRIDDRWAHDVQRTHFYGLSAFVYESIYLGFLWVFRATDSEGYSDARSISAGKQPDSVAGCERRATGRRPASG
jgi:hypothetical protein